FDPRHLFTWTYRGRPATLPPAYAAQLAALSTAHRPAAARATPRVGDLVEVTSPGPWHGLGGEVELVGAVRCQVRVGDDLVSLALEAVRVVPASAARRARSII
ncbi:MAG TPA: hypothetical protein VFN34_07250, partial [Ornithinibacter sp.]|nr:hypothetical protein [Ornithinibacter sp.]